MIISKIKVKLNQINFLIIIIIFAFLLRLHPLNYPSFTSEEAMIAQRGYSLSTTGEDELGRSFPFLFNSSTDYQLPAVTYITAVSTLIFGKYDLGVRIPFVLISFFMLVIFFKISEIFSLDKKFQFFSTFIIAFSPALIFYSKIPNEVILISFSFVLLFYLLSRKKINLIIILIALIFSLTISKIVWWTLIPYVSITLLFFQPNLIKRTKLKILFLTFILTFTAIFLFSRSPNSLKSFLENDFSIFHENNLITIINRLRGEGLESGWPPQLVKILFNKLNILATSLLNWLSQLGFAALFGQFYDNSAGSYFSMGLFTKVLIFPFVGGLIYLKSNNYRKFRVMILYILILTFPSVFIYPKESINILVMTIPFITFIIALGLIHFNKFLKYLTLALIIFEVSINAIYLTPEIKKSNQIRPQWIKALAADAYNLSINNQVAISDNIVSDLAPFLQWYTPLSAIKKSQIQSPYRFQQKDFANVKIITSEVTFYNCGLDKPTFIISSNRDLAKIQRWLNLDTDKIIEKEYEDSLGITIAYLLQPKICVN